jgi:hypothetical protein
VTDLLKGLKNDSSPGISGLEVKILKAAHFSIAEPLVNLLNSCMATGHFPNEWKIAIVTPLCKRKGNDKDLNNYRGISVLPPLCKLLHLDSRNLEQMREKSFNLDARVNNNYT